MWRSRLFERAPKARQTCWWLSQPFTWIRANGWAETRNSRREKNWEDIMDIGIMLKLLHTLEQLRKHERWTRPQLEAYQAEALRRLREYAYAHSPFYQKFHQGLTDRPLHELPVLTKARMMEHFDEMVTDRTLRLEDVRAYAAQGEAGQRYQNRFWVNATSGSSGHPGFFLFD